MKNNIRQTMQPVNRSYVSQINMRFLATDMYTIFRKMWKKICIVILVIGCLGAFLSVFSYKKTYTASVDMKVDVKFSITAINNGQNASLSSNIMVPLIKSDLFKLLLEKETGKKREEINIHIENIENSNLFTGQVVSSDASDAVDTLKKAVSILKKCGTDVLYNFELVNISDYSIKTEDVRIKSILKSTVLMLGLGIVGVVIYLAIKALSLNTMHTTREISNALGVECNNWISSFPILPKNSRDPVSTVDLFKKTGYIERFRKLAMDFSTISDVEGGGQVILVTSSHVNEGVSYSAAGLAMGFVANGKKCTVVDGNMRNAHLYKNIGMYEFESLEGYLKGSDSGKKIFNYSDNRRLCYVLSKSRKKDGINMIKSGRMKRLIEFLKEKNDYVIIACDCMLESADALAYQEYCDAFLFVVRPYMTVAVEAMNCVNSLRFCSEKPIIAVMNREKI